MISCFTVSAGLLPSKIKLETCELEKVGTKKKWMCMVSYVLFVIHALYKIGGLAYAFLFVPHVQLHQLMIHTLLAMASAMFGFWYHAAYIGDPELFATYFKTTIRGNAGDIADLRKELNAQRTRNLAENSLQDLTAIALPYLWSLGMLVVCVAIISDPSMRLLLYAALPHQLQTWTIFLLCLLEEFRFLVILGATATPILQLQVISCQ